MYQALYRKWRPNTFSQVVGQQHITDTLQRQVAEGRTGHAYLFTGTRGTGKTTCARILAKAINCLQPVDGAPCNECEACRGIDEGRLLDITELDAASNNGVDNVRTLREEAVYTPSVLKKRVYIIDEVHMLSIPAFNALLKILEEPPEHLVFILATTELHKVPATILSRCQRYSFKRILPQDIAQQLLQIAQAEKIDLTTDGANLLSRMANGAMRDALSLLDQCRSYDGTLDSAALLDLLGLAGGVQTVQLAQFILTRNAQDALLLFDKLYRGGKDIAALLRELSDLCRDLMILQAAPDGGAILLTGLYDSAMLTALAKGIPSSRFIFMADVLQQTLAALTDSGNLRTEAELCLIKLCDESLCGDMTALGARMDRLERAMARGIAPAQTVVPKATVQANTMQAAPMAEEMPPLPEEPPLPQDADAPFFEPLAASVSHSPKADTPAVGTGGDSQIWSQLIEHYKANLRVDKRAFLNMATGVLDGDVMTVICRNKMAQDYLDCPEVNQVLQQVTAQSVGRPIRLRFTVGDAAAGKPAKSAAPAKAAAPASQQKKAAAPKTEPAQTPPWETPAPVSTDRIDELVAEGSRLEHFNIK